MAIAYVQSRASGGNAITSLALAFTSNLTADNLMVIGVVSDSLLPRDVSDSQGSNIRIAGIGVSANGVAVQVMYVDRIKTSAANTVTVNWTGSTIGSIALAEYSGLGTNPVDQTAKGTGSAVTAASTNSIVTIDADELLLVVTGKSATAPNTVTPGLNYTEREDNATGNRPIHLEERIVAATGTYAGAATLDAAANYQQMLVAFSATNGRGGSKSDDRWRNRPSGFFLNGSAAAASPIGIRRISYSDDAGCMAPARDALADNQSRIL